ncbi:MAG TPA: type II pantothenate kinase [Bacillales bacterium]
MNPTQIGIDVGGTLIKVAYADEGDVTYRKFPANQLNEAASWVRENFSEAEICVTGGKAALFQTALERETRTLVEFDATCRGIQYLLNSAGISLESFILTNAGTGTSIHFVKGKEHSRVGGSGIGGGTIMGLSSLLTGVQEYGKIVRVAERGNRGTIDLKVRHIYEGSEPPISGDLTASNFGRISEGRDEKDMLASVIGLVGESVATVSVFAAEQRGVSSIVFIGSSFVENVVLKEVVKSYTSLKGMQPVFVENGEYSGAVGALLALNQD